MSLYNFSPCSSHSQNYGFVSWENAFSDEELELIKNYCDKLPVEKAFVGGKINTVDEEIRRSKVSWVEYNSDIPFLYDRMAWVARQLNSQFYNFNLTGFVEHMQYTVYEEDSEGHYDWHIDMQGEPGSCPRKFSLVLQLSDPSEYEGGELQILTSRNSSTVLKQKGLIAGFPSWTLHRVTPVTKGIRKTLVVWIAGPQFV